MSLWRSLWTNQCLFTLVLPFLSLLFCFNAPLIQEIRQKVSLLVLTFSSTLSVFLHDRVKDFFSLSASLTHTLSLHQVFQLLHVFMIPLCSSRFSNAFLDETTMTSLCLNAYQQKGTVIQNARVLKFNVAFSNRLYVWFYGFPPLSIDFFMQCLSARHWCFLIKPFK